MATAPQSFGRSDLSGLGLLYVAPDTGANVLAEGLSGFLGQRIPTARMIMARRLAALDPAAQRDAKLKIAEEKGKLIAQMAANDRTAARIASEQGLSADETARLRVQMHMADRKNATDLAVARTQQDTELIKASTLDEARPMADALDSAIRAHELALSQGQDPNESIDLLVRDLQSINEAAANLPAPQQIALQQHAQEQIRGLRIQDARVHEATAGAITGELGNPTYFRATQHGPGASASFEELMGEARQGQQVLGAGGLTGGTAAPPAAPPRSTGGGGRGAGGGGSAPAPGGNLGAGMNYLDQLRQQIEQQAAADPFGGLGGFNDPLPGLGRDRPPKEGRVEKLAAKRPEKFAKLGAKVKVPKDGKRAQREEPKEDIDQIETQSQAGEGDSLSGQPEKRERPPRSKSPRAPGGSPAAKSSDDLLDELLPPQSADPYDTQRTIDEALPPQSASDEFEELLPGESRVQPVAPPKSQPSSKPAPVVTKDSVQSMKLNLDTGRARGLLFPPRELEADEVSHLQELVPEMLSPAQQARELSEEKGQEGIAAAESAIVREEERQERRDALRRQRQEESDALIKKMRARGREEDEDEEDEEE